MNELSIELGGGLRGLPIGASVDSVRLFFGSKHQSFKRSHDSDEADYWPDKGVFAYYNAANLLEAVEFSTPSRPKLQGACLIALTMEDAIDHLLLLDPETRIEPGGATSAKLGVSIWSSAAEPDRPVMSVITFGPGYYD